jgi:peroxiredoxin
MGSAMPQPAPVTKGSQGAGARRSLKSRLEALLLFPLLGLLVYLAAKSMIEPEPRGGLRPGERPPALAAALWIGEEPPKDLFAQRRVVVLHAWFADCPHCHREAPELVSAYRKYQGAGVLFVGLSPDSPARLDDCREFLTLHGITWANGLGAIETLEALLTDGAYFPAAWVIGADGKVIWNSDQREPLDAAIARALRR